jgi:hypothetical protein
MSALSLTQPSFLRAPLAWGCAIVALCAPLAFVRFVYESLHCDLDLFCADRLVGLVFDPVPDQSYLFILFLAVPTAFIALLASRVAARGPNPNGHWFMLGPVLAILGATVFFLLAPVHLFWVIEAESDRLAVLIATLKVGMAVGVILGLPLSLMTLLGAIACRLLARGRVRHYWFMLGQVLALLGAMVFFLFVPAYLMQAGIVAILGFTLSLMMTLLGAIAWRRLRAGGRVRH